MLGSNAPKHDGMFATPTSKFFKQGAVHAKPTQAAEPQLHSCYQYLRLTLLGDDAYQRSPERGRRGNTPEDADQDSNSLTLPKNRSTGNLLSQAAKPDKDKGRIRFSFDAGAHDYDYDTISR